MAVTFAHTGTERMTVRSALACTGLLVLATGALVWGWTLLPITVFYQKGRPTRVGTMTNRTMGRWASLGVAPFSMVTLAVPGRNSGRMHSTVLVVARYEGQEYLVSMLGEGVDWVRNVRAAGGRAAIRHGRIRAVNLEEVKVEERAPILKAYLKAAPGGRPHFPVGPDAPVAAFEPLAARYPTFRVVKVSE